jgi:membrane-associated phospholipid phosphatase
MTTRRLLVAGTATFVVLVLGVVARRTAVSEVELDVFRWVNGWPDAGDRAVWLVMQLGWLWGGLAVGVLVTGLLRGWRGAVAGIVAAVGAWSLAVVVKAWVARGRPADYLDDVHSRFETLATGNGYPSGHTAVAFAVAALVAGSLPARWRILPYALATVVGLGRLYFGAHLPLDVLGGAALGIAVGTLCRFMLAEPATHTGRVSRTMIP